jgi:hypothetical protein
MSIWDFDEKKNFTTVLYKGLSFKVLNFPNKNIVAKRLYQAKVFIHELCIKVYKNLNRIDSPLREMSIVFLSIHPDYYLLQEMQTGTQFEGMNKPKNVRPNQYLPSVGRDKKLKAEYRIVFLNLIKPDGKVKSFKELIPLIMHEIAHTGCNHVTWKDDNHGLDFQLFEAYLYYLLSSPI